MSRYIRATALLALLILTTACGADGPFPSGAPRVATPKDLRGIPACSLLTPAQLTAFGFDPTHSRTETQDTTERCLLSHPRYLYGGSVTSAYRWEIGGLDRLYRNRDLPGTDFIPGTLDGYPTVQEDQEFSDFCGITIGVADNQLLIVSGGINSHLETDRRACELAREIGSAVLSNLPALH
jgi:hypothetical protein